MSFFIEETSCGLGSHEWRWTSEGLMEGLYARECVCAASWNRMAVFDCFFAVFFFMVVVCFFGACFFLSMHEIDQEQSEQLLIKRWREHNPVDIGRSLVVDMEHLPFFTKVSLISQVINGQMKRINGWSTGHPECLCLWCLAPRDHNQTGIGSLNIQIDHPRSHEKDRFLDDFTRHMQNLMYLSFMTKRNHQHHSNHQNLLLFFTFSLQKRDKTNNKNQPGKTCLCCVSFLCFSCFGTGFLLLFPGFVGTPTAKVVWNIA